MTVIVNNKITDKEIKKAIKEMLVSTKKKSLKKFFGTAVDKIDAVEFQKKLRDEWD